MLDPNNLPENFCSVAWLQIHTEPNGDVMPCCYYENSMAIGNWKESKLLDIYHSDAWVKLRKDFIDNKKPAGCTKCWREEATGAQSMRQRFNHRYSETWGQDGHIKNHLVDVANNTDADGKVNKVSLATIDVIFNNLCNFACRSCGPGLSTGWYKDTLKLYPAYSLPVLQENTTAHVQDDLNELVSCIDEFSEVHFMGGEPMMQQEHYDFLQLLIDGGKTDVKIRYNTNLSLYKLNGKSIFDLLKQFTDVLIIGSIDAMGEQGAYIRKGFDWDTALDWLSRARQQLPNAKIGISAVYSLLNSYAAIDLCRYVYENQLMTWDSGFNLNLVHSPGYLRTSLLPRTVKDELEVKINELIDWLTDFGNKHNQLQSMQLSIEHWKNVLTFMQTNKSGNLPEFFKINNKLDSIRSESFKTTFPDLYNKIKDYDNDNAL